MITQDTLLAYTKDKYPNEDALIARSMVNYYDLKLREDKTESDTMHQQMIYDGVMELFEILSNQLATELGAEADEIFDLLKCIHIKT